MKYALGIACLSALSVALLAGPASPGAQAAAPAAAQADAPLADRVAALEKSVLANNAQIGALTKDLNDTRDQLDKALAYLGQQALAARDLGLALDAAEQQGFAVGENHASRKTLLEGWRKQIASAQADLPQRAPSAAPAAARATPLPRSSGKPAPKK
ncbi:MAG: hypothetical protein FJ299_03895 [Planctomycetes bacterium]|nr:hypothetical protein [Planctomycetota bacterium]